MFSARVVRSITVTSLALAALTQTYASAEGACAGADEIPNVATIARARTATLCLLNAERRNHGLSKLHRNVQLQHAASAHSRDMVQREYFAHDTPQGLSDLDRIRKSGYLRSASDYAVGENIAVGTGTFATPREIVSGWMKSPGHRANILTSNYREIGIGIAPRASIYDATSGGTYTTDFGVRQRR